MKRGLAVGLLVCTTAVLAAAPAVAGTGSSQQQPQQQSQQQQSQPQQSSGSSATGSAEQAFHLALCAVLTAASTSITGSGVGGVVTCGVVSSSS